MPKTKRRFLRYSLRTMLVVVLVLSVWLGYMANRAAKQRRAVEALRQRDAWIVYDFQATVGGLLVGEVDAPEHTISFPAQQTDAAPRSPDWLVKVLGIDWFGSVVYVAFAPQNDADLKYLKELPGLSHLALRSTRMTDAGLEHLQHLRDLEALLLQDSEHLGDSQLGRLKLNLGHTIVIHD